MLWLSDNPFSEGAVVKKILVVDDNEDFGSFFKNSFGDLGEIRLTYDLQSASDALENEKWDLLILDYVLNDGTTCFELLPLIKKTNARAVVIIVTGNADKDMAIEAVNLGVNGILEKPLQIEALLNRLSNLDWFQLKFSLDDLNRQILIGSNSYPLTSVEYRILNILMGQKNKLVTRQELENEIWSGRVVAKNALDTHLYNLKKKVPELKHSLASIHGTGYMLRIL